MISSYLDIMMYNVLDAIMDAETERYLSEVEQEGITKEQDEEIMKIKQRQVTMRPKTINNFPRNLNIKNIS